MHRDESKDENLREIKSLIFKTRDYSRIIGFSSVPPHCQRIFEFAATLRIDQSDKIVTEGNRRIFNDRTG